MSPIRLIVHGASGRMGQRIMAVASQNTDIRIVGAVCGPTEPLCGKSVAEVLACEPNAPKDVHLQDDLDKLSGIEADVVIDFSFAGVALKVAEWCRTHRIPLVQGTTGLDQDQLDKMDAIARVHPILRADNFSLGVNLLRKVLKQMSSSLPNDYNIECIEAHHNLKKDAPSGTAFALAHACREGRQWPKSCFVHGREGMVGERPEEEIGMHAVRGGSIIGDHSILFTNMMEQITISHRALDRDLFAAGAVRAGLWMSSKKSEAGQASYAKEFDMCDVLEL